MRTACFHSCKKTCRRKLYDLLRSTTQNSEPPCHRSAATPASRTALRPGATQQLCAGVGRPSEQVWGVQASSRWRRWWAERGLRTRQLRACPQVPTLSAVSGSGADWCACCAMRRSDDTLSRARKSRVFDMLSRAFFRNQRPHTPMRGSRIFVG